MILTSSLAFIGFSPDKEIAAGTVVKISSPATLVPGQTFTTEVVVTPGSALSGMQFDLKYDPALIDFVRVEEGNLLSKGGANTFFQMGTATVGLIKTVSGVIITPGKNAFSEGVFARITFRARSQLGSCALTLSNVVLGDVNGRAMQAMINNGITKIEQPVNMMLTSPVGGERWDAGTTHAITWSTDMSGYVRIELYKGDVLVKTITSAQSAATGTRSWFIPTTTYRGSDYRIKVTSTSNAAVYDWSDEPFTINGPPMPEVTVGTPNGGESWNAGSSYAITWSGNSSLTGYLRIELYKGDVLAKTITSSVKASTGSKSWLIPSTQAPGDDYRIKIRSTSNAAVFDLSDEPFTINPPPPPYINLTSPAGGEEWHAGTSHAITWEYGSLSGYARIELYKGDSLVRTITSSQSLNARTRNWTIASTETPGSDYRVKITSTSKTSVYSWSEYFTISPPLPPFITLTSPIGGESWDAGTSHAITWSTNVSGYLRIELYKGDALVKTITTYASASAGSRSWYISSTQAPGSDYRIKVTSTSNAEVYDWSDEFFNINGPS